MDPPACAAGAGRPAERRTMTLHAQLEGELGKGTFSTVRLARNKRSGEKVAVKCIDKSSLNQEDEEALMVEVQIMHKVCAAAVAAARVHWPP